MRYKTVLTALALAVLGVGNVFGQYEPPAGSEEFYEFSTPGTLGRRFSVTEFESLGSSRMNPALPYALQRVHLGAAYTSLIGTEEPNDGWKGHGGFLAGTLPTRAGVVTGSVAGHHIPYRDMDLGTTFSMNLGFSKQLYPRLAMGIALNALGGGADGRRDIGVSADIGALFEAGNIGFFGETLVGFALLNNGKWYRPVKEKSAAPAPFTPALGVSSQLLRNENWSLRVGADLALPSVRNGRLSFGGRLSFRERFALYGGWGVDARQIFDEAVKLRSLAPSVGVSVRLGADGEADSTDADGWSRSELRSSAAFAPLYAGILGAGIGVEAAFGVRDETPPEIEVGYAPEERRFLSPNNDGVRDELSFSLTIEEERYVRSWRLFILNDQDEIVREIRNKDDRPENSGLQGIIDRIAAVEKGVEIPDALRWDGRGDNGEPVPDGGYSFTVEATDDNGNSRRIEERRFVIDTVPPTVEIARMPAEERVFSPNGDGNKDEFVVTQDGSEEQLWEGAFLDARGNPVRTFKWETELPGSFAWDGRNDQGGLAADGVYTYRVASTDRAGNGVEKRFSNIIINTVASPVDLTVSRGAFSPNDDGSLDTLELRTDVPVEAGILDWLIEIRGSRGEVVKTYSGVDLPPETLTFDGLNDAGRVVPEGSYRASLSVLYENGNNPSATSPTFILDVTPPQADVRADVSLFSPNNDGIRDAARFFQESSEEELWTGRIVGPQGETVREATWRGSVDFRYQWDGRTEEGRIAADGRYRYLLEAGDAAGNFGSSVPVVVELDTSEAELFVSASRDAFSPNADGSFDQVLFFTRVQEGLDVESYELRVTDRGGSVVRSYPGSGRVPGEIEWDGTATDGTLAPDGLYAAEVTVVLANGNVSSAGSGVVRLDTVFPEAELETGELLFSPDGDGRKDEFEVLQSAVTEGSWEGRFLTADGGTVRTYYFGDEPRDISWDGTDQAGNRVPDGVYSYLLVGSDGAGNRFEERVTGIEVDTRPAGVFVTVSDTGFSPNGDGVRDDLTITTYVNDTDGAEFSLLEIRRESGELVKDFRRTDVVESREIPWDGRDEEGNLVEGTFRARFVAGYARGAVPEQVSTAFAVDVTAPEVDVELSPLPFSPDNDGVDDELNIGLNLQESSDVAYWLFEIFDRNNRFFQEFGGEGAPAEKIVWDGRSAGGEYVISAEEYPYRFEIADVYGNTTVTEGTIPVDILVVRDGDQLKVQISNINFAPNSPELILDPERQIGRKNREVLNRLAEIFRKYDAYRIEIAGHAVNLTGTEREEEEELLPLSLERAEAVEEALVERGVSQNRISTVGRGGRDPLVPHSDPENRWKNRRVEFILIR
mgnify:CR=1 FL=1